MTRKNPKRRKTRPDDDDGEHGTGTGGGGGTGGGRGGGEGGGGGGQSEAPDGRGTGTDRGPCPPCCRPRAGRSPEFDVLFHEPFAIWSRPIAADGALTLSCLPLSDPSRADEVPLTLHFGLDLEYDQHWVLTETSLGDLSSVLSLAPAETLTLVVKQTLRTKLEENTLKSTESIESFENAIVDKEVLNVTRASSRSRQWGVSGTGAISVAGKVVSGEASFTGSLSNSVERRSERTREKLAESTQKSARQLKTLQKTEVGRTTERVFETEERRVITNPYRDRGLTLNVYDVLKRFEVATVPRPPRPVAVLEIDALRFDRAFVERNSDFLSRHLLDQGLVAELELALEAITNPTTLQSQEQAREYAALAFRYLFDKDSIFGFNEDDLDSIEASFSVDQRFGSSGLGKAASKELGEEFAAANFVYRLYRDLPRDAGGEVVDSEQDLLVGLAIALAEFVGPELEAVEENKIKRAFNDNDRTEGLRRLPGFLAIVNGLLKPLLKPLEEEREAIEASGRAEFTISRVVEHLDCHRSYYRKTFLQYLWELTGTDDYTDLFRRLLARADAVPLRDDSEREELPRLFDFAEGFLDGSRYVVPLRTDEVHPLAVLNDLLLDGLVGPDGSLDFEVDLEADDPYEVEVPADGVYIEAIDNLCVLPDVPVPEGRASVDIEVDAREGNSPVR